MLTTDDGRSSRCVRSSSHQGRFIVTFDGVIGIDAAERLRDTVLSAPPLDDPDALWIHDLIGAGSRTRWIGARDGGSVEANPASDLLVLDGGALIPLRFVIGVRAGRAGDRRRARRPPRPALIDGPPSRRSGSTSSPSSPR